MDNRNICVFDYETTGRDKNKCEITQIGGCIIDRWKLETIDTFKSMAKPLDFDAIEEEALQVTGITREQLEEAPNIKIVWSNFTNWVQKYNKSKNGNNSFMAPIAAGYNITGYDLPITDRYCKKYGPWDEKWQTQKLFNPVYKIDVMDHMWFWTENNAEVKSLKLTSICEWMGFTKAEIEGAHDALQDVKNTAKILIRLLKMERGLTDINPETGEPRLQMKDSFKCKK